MHLADPPDSWTLMRLMRLMGTRVQTMRGPGVLWDQKGKEAWVILEASPKVWAALET